MDDDFIDWDLMGQRYWNNTPSEPQRKERRMAEALVHAKMEWEAVIGIGVQNDLVAAEVRAILGAAGLSTPVYTRPTWYY